MLKKIAKAALLILFLAVCLLAVRFLLTEEDDWICTPAGWGRHGHPSAPRPTTVCQKAEQEVTIFLGNSKLNPAAEDCSLVYPAQRIIGKGVDKLAGAVSQLLLGATEAEQAAGYGSFFTAATAGFLNNARVEGDTAFLDFNDFRGIIPNASASCGSAQLLAELNNTVKAAAGVKTAVYSFNGSTVDFYEWLQLSCGEENNWCE